MSELTFKQRLLAAMGSLSYMQKGGKNNAQNYKFLEEADVKAGVNSACRQFDLVITELTLTPVGQPTPDAAVVSCFVRVSDVHSEQSVTSTGLGCGNNRGKAVMAANAVALKYAMTSLFQIATGDDPENDTKFQESKPAAVKTTPPKAPAASEKSLSVDAVLIAIELAGSLELLEGLKPAIVKHKADKEGFDKLSAAYRDRGKALKEKNS